MTKKDITPLTHTRPNPVGMGGRTSVAARRIIKEVESWAGQIASDDSKALLEAMKDLNDLLITCWTEVDESQTRLSLAQCSLKENNIEEAKDNINTANCYLDRWQDRDGAVGNVALLRQELPPLGGEIEGLRLSREVMGDVYRGQFKIVVNPHEINKEILFKVWPEILNQMVANEPKLQESVITG